MIKLSLNFMSEEITKVSKQKKQLLDLMEKVHQLKAIILEKDKKIGLFEK